MATLAEHAEAIYKSTLINYVDTNELIDILRKYQHTSGEPWHGSPEIVCTCTTCCRNRDGVRKVVQEITSGMDRDQLHNILMNFIYDTDDEDLEGYFENELIEAGYNFEAHHMERR